MLQTLWPSPVCVTASLGSNLAIAHDVQVLASNTTRQEAKVTGIVGHAAQGPTGNSGSKQHSNCFAGNGARDCGCTLVVNAAGSDDTYSEATSGSGGAVAGAAAPARPESVQHLLSWNRCSLAYRWKNCTACQACSVV